MKKTLLYMLLICVSAAYAAIPSGYYDSAEGLSGTSLRLALHNIIDGHNKVSYTPGVWTAYGTTDLKDNGKIWDMYTDTEWDYPADQSSGSDVYTTYNREHSWPKSWFGTDNYESYYGYTDLFHLYPVQAYANSNRSNLPYGEVADGQATFTTANGTQKGPARSDLGYSGTVFEPIDEYKGDLARTYFYMCTRYYTEDANWSDVEMSNKTELKTWALDMLLTWHENDPVSQKELDRIEAVYDIQNNRNPFIDHPEYVEAIWGSGISTLDAPVAAAATNIDTAGFTANWGTVDDATGYFLYVASDSTFSSYVSGYNEKNVNNVTTYVLGGLQDGTDYYYRCKAYSAEDTSAYSNTISLTTTEIVPEASGDGGVFISEYIEGSSYNKAIEIFNNTGAAIDLADITLSLCPNGAATPEKNMTFSGTLENRTAYVVCHKSSDADILAVANTIEDPTSVINFNGDDVVQLYYNGDLVDCIGNAPHPNDNYFAKDVTLVRKVAIITGNTTYDETEWDSYAQNTFSYLGSHTAAEAATPIALNDFSARCEGESVILDWTTASELENAHFNIYRNDTLIGAVAGAGTSSETHSYSYTDSLCGPGLHTYCLASYSYANTEVRFDSLAQTVQVAATDVRDIPRIFSLGKAYPNPFNPVTRLPLTLHSDADVTVRIFSLDGQRRVTDTTLFLSAGRQDIMVDASRLSSGIYVISVTAGDQTLNEKITLVK